MRRGFLPGASVLLVGLAGLLSIPSAVRGELYLEGRVVDPDGAPIAGASVLLLSRETAYEGGLRLLEGRLPEPVWAAKTDAEGRYLVEVPEEGLWRLRIEADGWLAMDRSAVPILGSRSEPDLPLEKDAGLEVLVVGPDGEPVPDALVRGWRTGLPGPVRPFLREGVSDVEGRAHLPREEREALDLLAWAPGYTVAERENVGEEVTIHLQPDDAPGLAVRLRTSGGGPAAGALVWGRFARPLARADEGGEVSLPAAFARRTLYALAADGEAATFEPRAAAGGGSAIALVPPATISTRVLDRATGEPLAGALVWLVSSPGRFPPPVATTAPSTWTDAEGGARLELQVAESLVLGAARTGYAIAGQTLPGLPTAAAGSVWETASIELEPTTVIRGTVRSADGDPLEGVRVTVWKSVSRGRLVVDRTSLARTSSEGSFLLAELRPGTVYRLRAELDGWAPGEQELAIPDGTARSLTVEMVLRRGARAWGTVLDDGGNPVPGAVVVLARSAGLPLDAPTGTDRKEGVSDGEGVFRFRALAAGRYRLTAHAEGFAPALVPAVEIPESAEGGGEAEIELGTVRLEPGARISGWVADIEGHPLEGAVVELLTSADLVPPGAATGGRTGWGRQRVSYEAAVTDGDGFFQVDELMSGGTLFLTVRLDGYVAEHLPGVVPPLEAPLEIALEEAAVVAGEVVDGEGEPVAKALILLMEGSGVRPAGHAQSDEEGRFRIDAVPPGRYRPSVRTRQGTTTAPEVEVARGARIEDLRIVLQRAAERATVQGNVVDRRGDPVAGARVSARGNATVTDHQGSFTLEGIETGEQMIQVFAADRARTRRLVELVPGLNRVDLELDGGVEVEGWVVGPEGEGRGGVAVYLGRPSAAGRRSVTDETGAFRFSGIEAGLYVLSATPEGEPPVTLEDVRVGGEPVRGLELRLQKGGSVSGRISGVEPDTWPRVRIQAVDTDGGARNAFGLGADGSYRLEHLRPGEWRVRAMLPQGGGAEGRVVVEAGIESRLDLEIERGLVLRGTVLRDDQPLAGVSVIARGIDVSTAVSAQTDYRGRFELAGLVEGRYTVEVRGDGGPFWREIELLHDDELVLELQTGRVTGWVLDAGSGEPLEGAVVTLTPLGRTSSVGRGASMSLRSGQDGRFRSERATPGPYRVSAAKRGYSGGESQVEVVAGSEAELRLALEPAARLELRLHTGLGMVPTSARIAVSSADGMRFLTDVTQPVDSGGRMTLETLPPGLWQGVLTPSGGLAQVWIDLEVPNGRPIDVLVPLGGRLRVEVPALRESSLRATLRAVDGLGRFYVSPLAGRPSEEIDVRGGVADLASLAPGRWTVEVTAADGRVWRGSILLTEGGRQRLVLE